MLKDWAGKESRMTLGFWPDQPEGRVATDQYREGCKLTGLRAGGSPLECRHVRSEMCTRHPHGDNQHRGNEAGEGAHP